MALYQNMFCGGGHLGFQISIKHVFVEDLPRNTMYLIKFPFKCFLVVPEI